MKTTCLLLLLLPALAYAACPNACSGHGSCGEFDMCTCHTNWEGGDCSRRVCPFNWAWVTTSNGDLNFDGDAFDGTEYNNDYPFSQGDAAAQLVTQRNPGGTWESWPYHGASDEGHFYMECSNRGVCDSSSGECVCFDGYSGSACRRSVCPNDCSGHGTCETVAEMAALAGATYQLWDRDMQRTCLCDPGYTGPSCSERICPYGDDPLTTNQHNEVQYVDIKADDDFSGYIALKYTDYYDEEWTTDYVAIAPASNSNVGNFAALETALESIPNDVITSATVTKEFCEKVIPGQFKTDGAGNFASATNAATSYVLSAGDVVRCPDATSDLMLMSSASAFTQIDGTTASGETAVDDKVCFLVSQKYCMRLKIEFTGTPGNLQILTADTSKVTVGGKTDAQDSSNNIDSSVSSTPEVAVSHATGGITASHTAASSVSEECASSDLTISTNTITCASSADYTNFGKSESVYIYCKKADNSWKGLGYYTVSSSTDPTTTVLTLEENAPTCSNDLKVQLQSEFISFNADLTSSVSAGDRLTIASWDMKDSYVDSVLYDSSDGNSRVFFSNVYWTSDLGSSTAGTDLIKISGDGTTESNECSDRGLCNRETGTCKCFKGYAGDACETQNTLAA